MGFAPAESPRLVCAVVLEEPRGKLYYASEVAAPVFSSFMSQALAILRIAPAQQRVPSTILASSRPRYPSGVVPAARRETAAEPAPPPLNETPDAAGLSARQALALFARSGVSVRLRGTGFVVSQVPAARSPIRPGQVHQLQLAESIPGAAASSASPLPTGRDEARRGTLAPGGPGAAYGRGSATVGGPRSPGPPGGPRRTEETSPLLAGP